MERRAVDIWTISLDEDRALTLSVDEQERAARFHFDKDRLHWSRARSALRSVLSRMLRVAPLEICFRIGDHGKPSIIGNSKIQFSLSHSREWAMIAVTRDVAVGIDLEAIRGNVDIAKLLKRVGESDDPATLDELFHRWTRREARTKAVGGPLMQRPAATVHATDLRAPEGFAASVALDGFEPAPVYQAS